MVSLKLKFDQEDKSMFGTNGPDLFIGTLFGDIYDGLGGNDTILGSVGNDTLFCPTRGGLFAKATPSRELGSREKNYGLFTFCVKFLKKIPNGFYRRIWGNISPHINNIRD